MFVRTLDDLVPGKGVIRTASWSSHRLLHRDDGIGVTLTDAVLEAGLDQMWWYKNHLEAVYCLEGEGVLEDLGTGKFYEIRPGTLYALDKHERHRLKVKAKDAGDLHVRSAAVLNELSREAAILTRRVSRAAVRRDRPKAPGIWPERDAVQMGEVPDPLDEV